MKRIVLVTHHNIWGKDKVEVFARLVDVVSKYPQLNIDKMYTKTKNGKEYSAEGMTIQRKEILR